MRRNTTNRPAPFFSVIWNEGELMQKFGIRIVPINMTTVQDRFYKAKEEKTEEIAKYMQVFKDNYQMDNLTPQYLERMACLLVTYKGLFEEFKLDVISAECWTATPTMFDGLVPCAVYGILNDLGYIISCESDMHCALTMALISSAAFGKQRPFLGEFKDLQAWEGRLLDGPYIHHFVEIEGDYTKELLDFCKYFPNLRMDDSIKGC